jgi:GNAT superfamily N-acetyltransferase
VGPVRIRPATPSDVGALQDLFRRSSLANQGDREVLLAHPDALEWSDRAVIAGHTRVATRADGLIVGFVTILPGGAHLELDDLFVDPDWMGQGIGRALVADAGATAADGGVRRIEVTANPHALGFYQKVGFVPDAAIETRFGPGVRMHLDIS